MFEDVIAIDCLRLNCSRPNSKREAIRLWVDNYDLACVVWVEPNASIGINQASPAFLHQSDPDYPVRRGAPSDRPGQVEPASSVGQSLIGTTMPS